MSPDASGSTERSPLLRPVSPASSAGGSRLNPLAASFSFVPKQQQQAPAPAPQPVSYAQAAKAGTPGSTAATPPNSAKPGDDFSGSPTPTKPSYSQIVKHQTESPTQLQAELPKPTQPQQDDEEDDEYDDDDASSCHSCESGSSTSLDDSLLPSRRSFYRSHLLLQFPPTALLVVAAFLALAIWRREVRWADLLLGAGSWLASESLKELIFATLSHETVGNDGRPIAGTGLALPTFAHAVTQEAVRLGGIVCAVGLLPEPVHTTFAFLSAQGPMPPLPPPTHGPGHERRPLPPLDTLFFSALWFALGWATVEILWGCRDFWRRMSLYDDVLVDKEADEEEAVGPEEVLELAAEAREAAGPKKPTPAVSRFMRQPGEPADDDRSDGSASTTYGTIITGNASGRPPAGDEHDEEGSELSEGSEEAEEEALMDARMRAVEREEVEGQLGVPLFDVPVGVVVVWRVDSILLSLVLTLVLSLPFRTSAPSLVAFPLVPTFLAAAAAHAFIALLWVEGVKRAGIPSVSYLTLVLLLFATFAALAAWGALE